MYVRPILPQTTDVQVLRDALQKEFDRLSLQFRALQDGRLTAVRYATAAPTQGKNAQGDIVRNSNPVNVAATPDYVTYGWLCTVSGEPGTFVELRIPTE